VGRLKYSKIEDLGVGKRQLEVASIPRQTRQRAFTWRKTAEDWHFFWLGLAGARNFLTAGIFFKRRLGCAVAFIGTREATIQPGERPRLGSV